MLSNERLHDLQNLVSHSLDRAESIWDEVGVQLTEKTAKRNMVAGVYPTAIPGHPFVEDNKPLVDEFIAIVVDMRESSRHLLCDISPRTAKVSLFHRVYFETSALLPAIASAIQLHDGHVVEYLGDGVLALLRVDPTDKDQAIYASHRAATDCLEVTRRVVNPALTDRYNLPPLNIGVGMALSKAIVTLVGLQENRQPKAIGECVWRATKLSGGVNQIIIDEKMQIAWPKRENGPVRFKTKNMRGVTGFVLEGG